MKRKDANRCITKIWVSNYWQTQSAKSVKFSRWICIWSITKNATSNSNRKSQHLWSRVVVNEFNSYDYNTTFLFHDEDDFILCSLTYILTLVFVNDAFVIEHIKSSSDLYRLRVRRSSNSISIRWKKTILKKSLFRQTMRIDVEFITFNESLLYFIFNHDLARLDESVDFENILNEYCIRRVIENAIDDEWKTDNNLIDRFVDCVQTSRSRLFVTRSWDIIQSRISFKHTSTNEWTLMFKRLFWNDHRRKL